MLVITRRLGESVFIQTPSGEKIQVVLTTLKKGHARIGILAEKDVNIWRAESGVYDPNRKEEKCEK